MAPVESTVEASSDIRCSCSLGGRNPQSFHRSLCDQYSKAGCVSIWMVDKHPDDCLHRFLYSAGKSSRSLRTQAACSADIFIFRTFSFIGCAVRIIFVADPCLHHRWP